MAYIRDDPTFSDIVPIHLTNDEEKIIHVICPEEFTLVMAYFRAMFAKQELSQRALDLTTFAIRLNPSNYTIWHFRRQCIEALGSSWELELETIKRFCEDHPKNYQIWHHRKCCAEHLGAPHSELEDTLTYIRDDLKNYHVWSYRQWLLRTYPYQLSYSNIQRWYTEYLLTTTSTEPVTSSMKAIADLSEEELKQHVAKLSPVWSDNQKIEIAQLSEEQFKLIPLHLLPIWSNELRTMTELLALDIRNNSAWNQRAFILQFGYGISLSPRPGTHQHETCHLSQDEVDRVLIDELAYSIDSIYVAPRNESVWNYIIGLTKSYHCRSWALVVHTCYHVLQENPSNRFALSALVEILLAPHVVLSQIDTQNPVDVHSTMAEADNLEKLIALVKQRFYHKSAEESPHLTIAPLDNLKEAQRTCEILIQHDSLRFKYWIHRRNQINLTTDYLQAPVAE